MKRYTVALIDEEGTVVDTTNIAVYEDWKEVKETEGPEVDCTICKSHLIHGVERELGLNAKTIGDAMVSAIMHEEKIAVDEEWANIR